MEKQKQKQRQRRRMTPDASSANRVAGTVTTMMETTWVNEKKPETVKRRWC